MADAKFVKSFAAHNKDVLSAASGHRFGEVSIISYCWFLKDVQRN